MRKINGKASRSHNSRVAFEQISRQLRAGHSTGMARLGGGRVSQLPGIGWYANGQCSMSRDGYFQVKEWAQVGAAALHKHNRPATLAWQCRPVHPTRYEIPRIVGIIDFACVKWAGWSQMWSCDYMMLQPLWQLIAKHPTCNHVTAGVLGWLELWGLIITTPHSAPL